MQKLGLTMMPHIEKYLRRVFSLGLLGIVLMCTTNTYPSKASDRHSVSKASVAVDLVNLKNGKQLRGLLFAQNPDGSLRMIVERRWLEQSDQGFYRQAADRERQEFLQSLEELSKRIPPAKASASGHAALVDFLALEADRIEELQNKWKTSDLPLSYRFMWVQVTAKEVKSIAKSSDERRRLAVWAWAEDLSRVESRTYEDLAAELAQRNIDFKQSPPDLSRELAAIPESEKQWAARLELVRSARGKPLEFQGSGKVFVSTEGAGKQGIEIAKLVSEIGSDQIQQLLEDLNGAGGGGRKSASSDSWLDAVTLQADSQKAFGFRVTRILPHVGEEPASVETAFVVKFAGQWNVVWRSTAQTPLDQVDKGDVARIAADPQVASALSILKALGSNVESQIQTAVRYAAAIESSQKRLNSQFNLLRDRYQLRLDGPPLSIPLQ